MFNEELFKGAKEGRRAWDIVEDQHDKYAIVSNDIYTCKFPVMIAPKTVEDYSKSIRIVYFHANESNANVSMERLKKSIGKHMAENSGLTPVFVVPEYPGYSTFDFNVKDISKTSLERWCYDFAQWLKQQDTTSMTVFIGHSIGTCFACKTASFYCTQEVRLNCLWLLSPIYSVQDAVFAYAKEMESSFSNMIKYVGINVFFGAEYNYFDNHEALTHRNSRLIDKISIVVGEYDRLSKNAAHKLGNFADSAVQLVGANHNDTIGTASLVDIAESILEQHALMYGIQPDDVGAGEDGTRENKPDPAIVGSIEPIKGGGVSEQADD